MLRFVFTRISNKQTNIYLLIQGLIESTSSLSKDSIVRVAALFDNEECGSGSYQGALSNMLEALVRRISCPDSNPNPANYELALANSFLLSSDQAHAVHPNYRYM